MNHVQIKWKAVTVTVMLVITVIIFVIVYYPYWGMPVYYAFIKPLDCAVLF